MPLAKPALTAMLLRLGPQSFRTERAAEGRASIGLKG